MRNFAASFRTIIFASFRIISHHKPAWQAPQHTRQACRSHRKLYRSQRHKYRFWTKALSLSSTLLQPMLCQIALMWHQKPQVPVHAPARCTPTCTCISHVRTHIHTPAYCTLMHAHTQKQLSHKKSHPTATSPPLSQCGVSGLEAILTKPGDAVSPAVAGARPVYQVIETMQLSFCAKSGRQSGEPQPYSTCHCCRCAPLQHLHTARSHTTHSTLTCFCSS